MSLWERDGFCISTDTARVDVARVHRFLHDESYWAKGIPLETVRRAIGNSLCFGIYRRADGALVGFARVVTDRATFAYLADVFVVAECRGQGLSKWLVGVIVEHPQLQGLRRWMLGTLDAHGLYAQYGFTPLKRPERIMERHDPDVYTRQVAA